MHQRLVLRWGSMAIGLVMLAASGCKDPPSTGPTRSSDSTAAPVPTSPQPVASSSGVAVPKALASPPDTLASAPASGSAVAPDGPSPCPADMAFVEGDHCSLVEQMCLEHAMDKDDKPVEPICLRFEKPSICKSTGRWHLRYCMDRYEYPNKIGEKPLVLVDFRAARKLCKAQHKRLCTPAEFNFACEGEQMWPYATGFERDPTKCNIDKEWRKKSHDMLPYDECMKSKPCAEQFARLDQRHAIGEPNTCVSPFGIYDLNGNVNEWVFVPWGKRPFRGGIKGGWWGPVRNRCRPIVTAHDEKYTGYEVGFRCCKDAAGAPPVTSAAPASSP